MSSDSELFKITSSALPDKARVAAFRGTEGISRPYQFDVFVHLGVEGQSLELGDAIGAKAKLEIDRADGRPPFVVHGILAAFELVHEVGDRSLFHAVLVPQLWGLTQTFHSRIFTNKSVPDIVKDVLEDSGLSSDDYALKLAADYKPQEHVCQYGESNFDFISRWMEREGLYYYFEQGDSAEKLIITDNKSFQHPLPDKNVTFWAVSGHDGSSREALHTFTCKHRALPASIKLKDYDYTKPTLDVSGTATVTKTGLGEISVYGGRFFSPDEGKRLAKLRAEELLARQVVYRATGTALYMRSGYLFTLEDHPRAAFDIEYLVTDVEHVGNQSIDDADMQARTGIDSEKVYVVEVQAIPASIQFRAESKTAWPRVDGFENGTICGPAETDYAQIDSHGRYNVKFKFDESDLKDGKASTWVRMMQPHGGSPEGFHFPLRKGTEVMFTFLGGDPDRPVIAGVVPNTHNPSSVTEANHTKNVIQTGGLNRFELEDKKGSERITLQTPHTNTMIRMGSANDDHNLIVRTDGMTLLDAGQDWDVKVGGVLDEDVKHSVTENYHDIQTTNIALGRTETIAAGGLTQDITGEFKQTIKPGGSQTVTGEYLHKVTGENHDDYGTWKTDVKGKWEGTFGGNVEIKCPKWEVFQTGAVDWKNVGDISWSHLANEHKLTVGLTTETMVGLKLETFIGGCADICIGAKADITLAATYEMKAGPHGEFKTMKMITEELEAKERALALEDCEAAIKKHEADINKHDFEIHLISAIILA
jgi:type VI secretion system secreted protein VgrG